MTDQTQILQPAAITWARWRQLRRTTGSLARELMTERLRQIPCRSPVLDVGGGAAADYMSGLDASDGVLSVNIDREMRPSVIADAAGRLPFRDEVFATVLSFNTLEHLGDDASALAEMVRVLRPGGWLHVMVPFLYRVHAHPDDYHRHTATGWTAQLVGAGIPPRNQLIEPLVWDPFSTAWAIADIAPLGRSWWRARRFVRPLVLGRPLVFGRVDRRSAAEAPRITAEHALAYYVAARKPE